MDAAGIVGFMNAINVKKSELLAVLRQNRAQHRKIFLEAQTGYRQQVIDELDSMLRDARDGKKIRRSVTLIEPVDQTADYDRAIRMMEMSVDDVIQLEEHEFNSYVLDNWSWQKNFNASNARYSQTLMAALDQK